MGPATCFLGTIVLLATPQSAADPEQELRRLLLVELGLTAESTEIRYGQMSVIAWCGRHREHPQLEAAAITGLELLVSCGRDTDEWSSLASPLLFSLQELSDADRDRLGRIVYDLRSCRGISSPWPQLLQTLKQDGHGRWLPLFQLVYANEPDTVQAGWTLGAAACLGASGRHWTTHEIERLADSTLLDERSLAHRACGWLSTGSQPLVRRWLASGRERLALIATAHATSAASLYGGDLRRLVLGDRDDLACMALACLQHVDEGGVETLAADLDRGSVWRARSAAYTLARPSVDAGPARASLVRALSSTDRWTVLFAARALAWLEGGLDPIEVDALERLASQSDRACRLVAEDTLLRGDPAPGRWIDRLLAPTGEFDELFDRARRPSRSGLGREATLLLGEIRRTGPQWLRDRHRGVVSARDPLRLLEDELRAAMLEISGKMASEIFDDRGEQGLALFGALSMPTLEARDPSFRNLEGVRVATAIGPRAWPFALAAVDRMGSKGLWRARDLMAELEWAAEIVAPFFAMEFARQVSLARGVHVTTNGLKARHAYADDLWVTIWRGLGAAGDAALQELEQHPDPFVREALDVLRSH